MIDWKYLVTEETEDWDENVDLEDVMLCIVTGKNIETSIPMDSNLFPQTYMSKFCTYFDCHSSLDNHISQFKRCIHGLFHRVWG